MEIDKRHTSINLLNLTPINLNHLIHLSTQKKCHNIPKQSKINYHQGAQRQLKKNRSDSFFKNEGLLFKNEVCF